MVAMSPVANLGLWIVHVLQPLGNILGSTRSNEIRHLVFIADCASQLDCSLAKMLHSIVQLGDVAVAFLEGGSFELLLLGLSCQASAACRVP